MGISILIYLEFYKNRGYIVITKKTYSNKDGPVKYLYVQFCYNTKPIFQVQYQFHETFGTFNILSWHFYI